MFLAQDIRSSVLQMNIKLKITNFHGEIIDTVTWALEITSILYSPFNGQDQFDKMDENKTKSILISSETHKTVG